MGLEVVEEICVDAPVTLQGGSGLEFLENTSRHVSDICVEVRTPIKAIRAKCMDCTCNQPKEVRECPITTCPLWPYRMGKRPNKAENVEEAEQEAGEVAAGT